MVLVLHLCLLLLLAVALPARAAQASPPQAPGADLDRNLNYLQVLVNDTLKIMENAGAEPVGEGGAASQPIRITEPLGDGVSAGRTFQAPLLVNARKPSSHHREMEGEAVLTAEFPRGSSGSLAASAAGREAMPGTVTGDEVYGKASPLAWLNKVLKPLEPPADVSAGRIFPVPLLIAPHKPGSHHRGPPRGKNIGTGKKKFREPNNSLKQIVMELHKGHGIDREALWKAAFPKGREAMPGTVTGVWHHELEMLVNGGLKTLPEAGAEPVGKSDLASQPTFRIEPLGDGEVTDRKAGQKEVFPKKSSGPLAAPAAERKAMTCTGTDAASTTTPVPDSQKGIGRGFCKGTGCWLGLIAGMLLMDVILILCCVGIRNYWKRKCRTSGQEMNDGGCTSHPDSLSSSSSNNKGLVSPFKSSEKRTPEHLSTRKPPMTM
ncbi:uncharacterized protein LOC128806544 isoform X2 [Vidua macroura]|uniref:uncharacterized protein LOC128806544 isoform X2 n=1 Tax=Vidua macroura TaxID=187451 RepID=UPI0023A7C1A0|nr:uncharacterized protein LOC128806544 isoform X2 [Vidua macroura]